MVGAQQIGAKNSKKLVAQMVGASQRPPVLYYAYVCVRVVQYLPTVQYLSRYLSNCATVVFQKIFLDCTWSDSCVCVTAGEIDESERL